MSTLIVLVVLTYVLKESVCTKCYSLNGTLVTVRTDRGQLYDQTLNGCIERAAFNGVVTQAYVKNQEVPKLGRDSVRNMKHLHSIQFYRCQVDTLEPGAFRNVPSLRSVQIVSNELKAVPEGVFQLIPELEILKLNRNRIDAIEDGAFQNVTTLKKVYLEHNLLEKWSKVWFAETPNIQVLNFQFNKIRQLPERAFYGLRKLREIYFDFNELELIERDAFNGVENLDILGLKYNRLRSIGHEAFPNKISIEKLMIATNYLNFLPRRVLDKIKVKELTEYGNPWKCPCLDEITSWLHRTNASLKNYNSCTGDHVPVCSFSSSQPRTACIETIDVEMTTMHFESLKKIKSLDEYCARLDN